MPLLRRWCHALDPQGVAACWAKVPRSQPGLICDGCWELLATDGTVAQRAELAAEPDLPPACRTRLLGDRSALVRAEVAARDDVPDGELEQLAGDDDERVQTIVARRTGLPFAVQTALLHSPHLTVLGALAANCDPQIAAVLARHPDARIARQATSRAG